MSSLRLSGHCLLLALWSVTLCSSFLSSTISSQCTILFFSTFLSLDFVQPLIFTTDSSFFSVKTSSTFSFYSSYSLSCSSSCSSLSHSPGSPLQVVSSSSSSGATHTLSITQFLSPYQTKIIDEGFCFCRGISGVLIRMFTSI